MEIVLLLGFADAIFRRERSDDRKCVCASQATKLLTDFAIDLESVRGATELLVQEELLNMIAEDLAVEVITSSFRELENVTCLKTFHLRQRKYFQGSPAN